ncbi:uncharacterized protein K489DRAFT_127471 [Dissoconium aciculare CBS 342.82]|uniref:Uncharacterized protein n=1 Tax=Dissoconium aciculare CBS 342.82 TaxID=1314786 RepID=A0A6J3LQX0_9PEZI|nr:uncharacterized protein K489DRAFT_127471 [Dissoconium aciculare CBS 342.82]KAF1818235.1 hypothetical protein K489DRAFT_127471 [Dissoconium aciculare CBS 342.82]
MIHYPSFFLSSPLFFSSIPFSPFKSIEGRTINPASQMSSICPSPHHHFFGGSLERSVGRSQHIHTGNSVSAPLPLALCLSVCVCVCVDTVRARGAGG